MLNLPPAIGSGAEPSLGTAVNPSSLMVYLTVVVTDGMVGVDIVTFMLLPGFVLLGRYQDRFESMTSQKEL